MVFNATLNNISVISLQSVLLVEETGLMKYYLVRNDMDVNEHDRLSNNILRHKLK